jgi:hypothetical protein
MYKPVDVPEGFGVRMAERKTCKFQIDVDPARLRSARLVVSTWSAATDDLSMHEIGLNGKRIADNFGVFHDRSFDVLPVPPSFLRQGENILYIESRYTMHGSEVNWPGPVLFVELSNERKSGIHETFRGALEEKLRQSAPTD